jgi:hypothetical protein
MRRSGTVPRVCLGLFATTITLLAAGLAASRVFLSYASLKPVLDAQPDQLPAELKSADETKWLAWARRRDKAIRARLEQGDLDSLANLLLLGTSFTKQPRIRMDGLTEASKSGVLRARVDDLVAALRNPGDNERLLFVQHLVRNHGIDADSPDGLQQTGKFFYENLQRVLQERVTLARSASEAQGAARSSLFRNRGVSLDTSIFPAFSIDQALRDLKTRGVLREGQISRVGVIGPGLDFIDKNEESAFDYYPQQTLQPFALYDSLVRLELAKPAALSLSVIDISSRVLDHLRRTRERAAKNIGYTIQLPRDISRPWPPDLVAYWSSLGAHAGDTVAPIHPPNIFSGLETRAIRIRPEVVLTCEPLDLDIILEQLTLAATDRFDLIVATNIFVYYDLFEQALALENAAAMLKPGGLLLTNDRLPEIAGGSMRLAGITVVPVDFPGVNGRDAVGWYRKQ